MSRGNNLEYSPSDYDRLGSRKISENAQKDSLDRDFQSIASKYKGSRKTGEDEWDQRSPYQQLRGSERAIETEISRANKAQDDRLEREIKNNSNFRQDLQNLRANIDNAKSLPKETRDYDKERIKQRLEERELQLSNRLGSPYLNEYEEEVIKRRQHEKEFEVSKRLSPRRKETASPDRAYVRAAQERREEEILEGYLKKNGRNGDRLKESINSNKTFELSQSLKSSVNYREKIGGGLKNLEAKIDNMEKELDEHLQRNEKSYFTNKELVKATQKRPIEDDEDEDETPLRSKKNQFQDAFERRETKIKEASSNIERSDQKSSRRDFDYDEEEVDSPQGLKRTYEDELDKLKYIETFISNARLENIRIKQEISEMKKSTQIDHQFNAATLLPEHPEKRTSKPQLPKKKDRPVTASNAGFNDMVRDDEIKKTVEKAKKKIQQKLEKNKQEKSQSKKAVVNYPLDKYVSLRRETEKKYTGSASHLHEAAFLLAKGMPTTFCSDTAVEPKVRDPKKTLPRKFEKILSQY